MYMWQSPIQYRPFKRVLEGVCIMQVLHHIDEHRYISQCETIKQNKTEKNISSACIEHPCQTYV